MAVSDWSTSASSNTSVGGINIAEGCARANINDAIRAVMADAKAKFNETVSVIDYDAVGDGVTDDSAAIQAAIDANQGGTIVLPAGYTFYAAGIELNGSAYNGTTIIVAGTLLMAASGGVANWDASVSPSYNAIIVYDCEDIVIDVPGVIDGNRANQSAWQQHHCVHLRGARNVMIPRLNVREIRGDGILITTKTNVTPFSTNSSNVSIGQIVAINSDYDGRNAISIVSGQSITVGSILASKIGAVINSERMPGGFNIEVDGAWHLTKHIRVGSIVVDTEGTSGACVIGTSLTGSDAAEDWNVEDVEIGSISVYNNSNSAASGTASGPVFKRVKRLAVTGCFTQGARGTGFSFDFINGLYARISATGVTRGALFGLDGWVRDFDVTVRVDDHSSAAVQAYGVSAGIMRVRTREPQGAGSYGLQVDDNGRTITQTNVVYDVDIPYDANISGAIIVDAGVTVGEGTYVTGSMTGYIGTAGAALQFITAALPTYDVQGRNYRTSVPPSGLWLQGDRMWKTDAAAAGSPGWVCTTGGTAGSTAVFGTMAVLA